MATFLILTADQGADLELVLQYAKRAPIDPKFTGLIKQRDEAVRVIDALYDAALDIEIEIEDEMGKFSEPPKFEGDV